MANKDLKYQLVFQFEASEKSEFLDMLKLTEELEEVLADEAETFVDGHDFGLGEFNIFIYTNRPHELFEKAADAINVLRPHIVFSAGYRAFDQDTYQPLHPSSSTSFSVA